MSRRFSLPFLRILRLLPGLLLTALALTGPAVHAQSTTETKIRLMADALRARDDGDLEAAERNLLELTELAPNDPSVERLLHSVQGELATEREKFAAPPPTPAPSPSVVAASSSMAVTPPTPAPSRSRVGEMLAQAQADEEAMEAEIAALAAAEEQRQRGLLDAARNQRDEAKLLARDGRFAAALATLETATRSLPENPMTLPLIRELEEEHAAIERAQAKALAAAQRAEAELTVRPVVERSQPQVATEPVADWTEEPDAWQAARRRYAAGDFDGAEAELKTLLARDPGHGGAERLLRRIGEERVAASQHQRARTRQSLMEEVGLAWTRPTVAAEPTSGTGEEGRGQNPLVAKLGDIRIPSVSFNSVELQRVVSTLSDLSREFDHVDGNRGVNILVIDPQNRRPPVSLTLRDLSLKRVLDFITDSIGYQYEVQADAVVVRPGGETSTLDTEFFPITRSTVIRMTGIGGGLASGGSTPVANDPFSPAPVGPVSAPGGGGEATALRQFLQQAGVDFEGIAGASLAYDGSAMIVTQTSRNVERIRNILNRYNDVRQVEIEAKFMEVQEGALDELGVNWSVSRRGVAQYDPSTGAPILGSDGRQVFVPQEVYGTDNRSIADAFSGSVRESSIIIDGESVASLAPPLIPGQAPLGSSAGPLANITGTVGEFDVNAVVRALSQLSGTDLLSAPRVTVLSGNPANITVAQEMRYPLSYGEIRSEVGRGGSSSSEGLAGGGVAITSGTPQDFTTRNVGVELKVTPTVEEDDYSISLDLNPKVTEFEGFVEYGGPSVAITGNRTVTVPPAFYQPIFSVRELSTKVTIWDGATLVMGGLTREEVKTVNDKVPLLGDIPGIGRLFRSKSESSQKRNLLIFVTANLVSPGGSPKKQDVGDVPASSIYQNNVLATPAGPEKRQ